MKITRARALNRGIEILFLEEKDFTKTEAQCAKIISHIGSRCTVVYVPREYMGKYRSYPIYDRLKGTLHIGAIHATEIEY